jgi:drug/metabolite transporter (DMT)-like permease
VNVSYFKRKVGVENVFVGLAMVVSRKLEGGIEVTPWSLTMITMALVSITTGTLYQKRFCPRFDLRSGAVIQFTASALITLPFAVFLENLTPGFDSVQWTADFIWALCWSVFSLSIGAIFLLFALIRKNAATQVSSLMYLTPPLTALIAWVLFDETLSITGALGMLLAVVGVAFVVRK